MPDLPKALKIGFFKPMKKARQYKTDSTTWRKLRMMQLHAEPLCRHCAAQGRTTPATQVDHINGDTWNNTPRNLQSLCIQCHTRKTNAENGGGWKREQV